MNKIELRALIREEISSLLESDILEGEAFDKLVRKFRAQGKTDPEGLAADIGRKKYGKKAFQAKAAAGRK
jgi:hypothetical protein